MYDKIDIFNTFLTTRLGSRLPIEVSRVIRRHGDITLGDYVAKLVVVNTRIRNEELRLGGEMIEALRIYQQIAYTHEADEAFVAYENAFVEYGRILNPLREERRRIIQELSSA